MTTKEFISRITDGTLLDNDIALYASKCVDVRVLLNDLYLAKIALDDITGKRYVKNHKEECCLQFCVCSFLLKTFITILCKMQTIVMMEHYCNH